ncbi:MAG: hypothetical protein GH151_02460, partial [Bacteroidetes bacterium]|nr:hypothetical protein [Bacteroidota bacterium]
MKKPFTILIVLILSFFTYCEKEENQLPACVITYPRNGDEFEQGDTIAISVKADDPDGLIAEVRFYIDDIGVISSTSFPYTYTWNTLNETIGNHIIKVTAKDNDGGSKTDECTISIIRDATVTTIEASSITHNSAMSGGNITNDGGTTIIERGICWNISKNPTLSNKHTTNGSGSGSFISSMTGLLPNTIYYVRAYATNKVGTAYGNEISFATSVTLPTVITSSVTDITYNSAKSGGSITADGGAVITAKGVCWSTSQNPTVSDSYITDGTGAGSFSSSITGLSPVTTYYIRAYATNSAGTAYGNQIEFTTTEPILPTVTTISASSITENSAESGGNITDDGGATITAKGVCWSTSQNPTVSDSYTSNGSGTGGFTSSLTGLTNGTTYYVRAYATNSVGTSYGSEVTFTTLTIPSLTTTVISAITENSAKSGGWITADGGAVITAKGVCWSTSSNPTTADIKTTDGSGTGGFTSSLTGLSPETIYYVRAYATNSEGT